MCFLLPTKGIFLNMDDEINIQTIKKEFAVALKKGIYKKFNKHLSIADFTIQYNLQFHQPISNETARKWLSGLSLPQIDKLVHMTQWLNLELPQLFGLPECTQSKVFEYDDLVNKIEGIYQTYKDKMELDMETLLALKELIKKL